MGEAAYVGADRTSGEATRCFRLVDFVKNVELAEGRMSVFMKVILYIEEGVLVDGLFVQSEPIADFLFDSGGCIPGLLL